jgi:hypothetical protein
MEARAANTDHSTKARLKTYTPAPIHKEDTRKIHCVNKRYGVSEKYLRNWPHLPKGVKASRPFIVSKLSLQDKVKALIRLTHGTEGSVHTENPT